VRRDTLLPVLGRLAMRKRICRRHRHGRSPFSALSYRDSNEPAVSNQTGTQGRDLLGLPICSDRTVAGRSAATRRATRDVEVLRARKDSSRKALLVHPRRRATVLAAHVQGVGFSCGTP
jgi:hypothetical protein